MSTSYGSIPIAGGDTAQPLALRKRLDWVRRSLPPNASRFIDCGCGAGDYVAVLRQQMALDACGVEFDIAKVHAAKTNPELADYVSQGDLQKLDLPSEHWHCAMLNEVLEHVPDEPAALREVNRILKLGGTLLVFSPNRWFPFETHGVFLRNSDKRVPHWTPFIPYLPLALGKKFLRYWARNYWHGELRRLVSEAGFSIIEIGYVWQTFEGISGREPRLLRGVKPVLRQLSNSLERTPFLRAFGVSQVLVARKTESALPLDGQGQTAR